MFRRDAGGAAIRSCGPCLPGNFFLVEGKKKGSINHCYLSVTVNRARLRWRHLYRVTACPAASRAFCELGGRAMADNEPAEGAEAAEAPAPKGKLKLIIAAAAVLLIVSAAATWFFFFRHSGEDMHAETAPPKPPVFLEVPEMLVNLVGSPGERTQ